MSVSNSILPRLCKPIVIAKSPLTSYRCMCAGSKTFPKTLNCDIRNDPESTEQHVTVNLVQYAMSMQIKSLMKLKFGRAATCD